MITFFLFLKAVCYQFWPDITLNSNAQEAAALAATEVAFILQSGRRQGLHLTLAPESPATPQQEPHQQQL